MSGHQGERVEPAAQGASSCGVTVLELSLQKSPITFLARQSPNMQVEPQSDLVQRMLIRLIYLDKKSDTSNAS